MKDIPLATRQLVIERDGKRCLRCSSPAWLTIHHRKGRGGSNPHAAENCVLLCMPCHEHIHRNPQESYADGWMVRRLGDDDPAEIPIRTPHGLLWLTDDGGAIYLERTSHGDMRRT